MSRTPRAYVQGANSRSSMMTMTMNAQAVEYIKAYLDGMKDSTKRKTVRRAFAIVGKRLIAQGKENLLSRQKTHNQTPGHIALSDAFQYRVVGFGRQSKNDVALYAGFDKHGHHSIWADRGIYNHKYEYRTRGNLFWTDVRHSAHSMAAPLIMAGIDQALGEGTQEAMKLSLDGTTYRTNGMILVI